MHKTVNEEEEEYFKECDKFENSKIVVCSNNITE